MMNCHMQFAKVKFLSTEKESAISNLVALFQFNLVILK